MGDQTDDFEEATTGRQIARAVVIALAASLAFLPAVVGMAASGRVSLGALLVDWAGMSAKPLVLAPNQTARALAVVKPSSSLPLDRRLRVLPPGRAKDTRANSQSAPISPNDVDICN